MLIAKIAVNKLSYSCDKLYSYVVPESLENSIKVGQRVIIPFGKGDSKRIGIIMQLENKISNDNLKNIFFILDNKPFLDDNMISLIKWMKEQYFCCYFDVIKLILPPGIGNAINSIVYKINENKFANMENLSSNETIFLNTINSFNKKTFTLKKLMDCKIKNYNKTLKSFINIGLISEEFNNAKTVGEKCIKIFNIDCNLNLDIENLTSKQQKVYSYLRQHKNATAAEITYFTGVSNSTIKTLEKKNVITSSTLTTYSSPINFDHNFNHESNYEKKSLNMEQKNACNQLLNICNNGEFSVSLLHGITGSGKTEVLLNIIDKILEQNKNVIFMIPEIALTTQFIKIFQNRYQNKVALIHSNLSDWQRFDTWKRIENNEIKIVLGTRSAVFAPFKNLGLIIVDEEHEFTYKSESAPRFNAKDVAKYRCMINSAPLILSSATPSIDTYYKTTIGKFNLVTLKNRYGDSKLPKVQITDMNNFDLLSIDNLSNELITALKNNLENNKQSIIFINRRGYNNFAKCRNCGEVFCCPNCSVSLNYHKSNNRLMCHYCGYSKDFSVKCDKCHQDKICYLGSGTQKIEDYLNKIFPYAKILRIDSDIKNITGKNDEYFQDFTEGKYDILIGTQMISKGFNFPNVTLVGVLSIDSHLYSGDFRSYEKTFSLLTQVIGRAGRDKFPGRAIIQTLTPENEILKLASSQDYKKFFESEIKMRKILLYPPFSDICIVGFVSQNEKNTIQCASKFFEYLKQNASENYPNIPLRIFTPQPANIKKIAGKYRHRIVMKCCNNKVFRKMISETLINFSQKINYKNVSIFVDVNPDTIL